jgi:hypothetical protein
MKLTAKEREALDMLRELDVQQRDKLLGQIRRAALAHRIVAKVGKKAGALKKVRTVPDHKVIRAYGTLPAKTRSNRKR